MKGDDNERMSSCQLLVCFHFQVSAALFAIQESGFGFMLIGEF